jgi:hypothetical protein
MALAGLFAPRAQAEFHTQRQNNGLTRTGSWVAFACASIAALALIISAGAQNVAHGYQLGLASSEFRAVVLALASAGASLLGPFAWLAVFRGRGFGTRTAALALAIGAMTYAGVCSIGFVHGSRDTATAANSERLDGYRDVRAVKDAARTELAALATIKQPTQAVLKRRRELAAVLAPIVPQASTAAVNRPVSTVSDPQAAAVGFYMRAAGWQVTDTAVGIWLSLGMTLFLETAAALGLTVAAGLYPTHARGTQDGRVTLPLPDLPASVTPAASDAARAIPDEKNDDPPPPPPPKGRAGRKPTVLPAQAVSRLRKAGGKANGSLSGIGKLLGTRSKTATHRLLHSLAAAGQIRLATGPQGIGIALA